ncbi:MAG: histidinol dehydrogenase, partial [Halocynthiibacter sp.]
MPTFLNTSAPGFEADFASFLTTKREDAPDVDATVAEIIAEVRASGDAAVIALTVKFDRLTLTPETLAFSTAEIDAACNRVAPPDRAALELAAQ